MWKECKYCHKEFWTNYIKREYCSEHSAQGWNNQVAIPGAHASYATNKDVLIYTRWVTSDGKVISNNGQNFEYFSIGL